MPHHTPLFPGLLILAATGLLTGILSPSHAAEPPGRTAALVTGDAFEETLSLPISAAWRNVSVREVMTKIAEQREVSLLLDRRIDPSRILELEAADQPLLHVLDELAATSRAVALPLASTVYIGPPAAAERLKTLIALRSDELQGSASGVSAARRRELFERQTLSWNDLDRPIDILQQIAGRHRIELRGTEQIPHDLWAGATLPEVTLCEALSLILIQFDLTFAWEKGAAAVTLLPAPAEVVLERTYTLTAAQRREGAARWTTAVEGMDVRLEGNRLVARGSLEQHEQLVGKLDPSKAPRAKPMTDAPVTLDRREFTLRIRDVPARALMRELEKAGIVFRYDAQALAEKNIDLDQRIEVSVMKVRAEEFFTAVFKPLGLRFEIDGVTVTLIPE